MTSWPLCRTDCVSFLAHKGSATSGVCEADMPNGDGWHDGADRDSKGRREVFVYTPTMGSVCWREGGPQASEQGALFDIAG